MTEPSKQPEAPAEPVTPLRAILAAINLPWFRPAAVLVCASAVLVKTLVPAHTVAAKVAEQVIEVCTVAGVASIGVQSAAKR